MSTLSARLRAMHAARTHHFTPDGGPQAFSIVATEERLQDLLEAADQLEDQASSVAHEADIAQQAMEDMVAALDLVSRIRVALGDDGRRMQDDLVEWCRGLSDCRKGLLEQHARDSAELRRLCAARDSMRAELAALKHENHNLNWALGSDGYERMYTEEEQAASDAAQARALENIERLRARMKRLSALVPVGVDPLDVIEQQRAELAALKEDLRCVAHSGMGSCAPVPAAPAGWTSASVSPQLAHDTLRQQLQQRCIDWGAYWRASDAHGVILTTDQVLELLRDVLCVEVEIQCAGQDPATVAPAGWQLVPVEPTTEMHTAGYETACSYAYISAWKAMLAAAPKGGE